ncbi:glucose-1-phosphate adenylyltransferase family protein [Nocardioides sp.]|uniref:glucose-1-phosphate adenylyltransferase family protein n=1 Tax=Nocardioides sp. TaxID=35761 RepID=UPI002ED0CA50
MTRAEGAVRTPRVLALIQAGGTGSRMDVLTRERAKPALPVIGVYQLVDFALSNLSHSGISDVWLSVQYHGTSLEDQVANGRPWDLDRTRGGLRLVMPEEGTGGADEEGFARGNADELYRIRDQIEQSGAEVVLVMSADHVYRFDFRDLVQAHLSGGHECTVVTTEVDVTDAGDHAVVTVEEGKVVRVDHKPDDPQHGTVAAEIVAYRTDALLDVVQELHRELGPDAPEGDSGLGDFAEHLLPRFVSRGRTGALALEGYWRDLGQPHYYLRAHREMLREDVGVIDVPGWPILSRQAPRGPARVLDGAELVDSLVSPGCTVAGRVERSVLGPGVRVEAGARIRDAVLFDDTVVEGGTTVSRAIVDKRCRIGAGAQVGSDDADLDDSDDIALLGADSVVAPQGQVPRGARLEPGGHAS